MTKTGLINRAKAQGHAVSPYLVDDWVERGLLDAPYRVGKGRGQGSASLWPEEQAQLFVQLLDKRQDLRGRSLRPLYNIPVALWLYWGDRWASTRQVHRALKSWMKGADRVALRRAESIARKQLEQIAHPEADRLVREWAFDVVTDAIRGDRDLSDLRDAVQRLFDPHDEHRSVGPPAAAMTRDSILRLAEARVAAWGQIENLTEQQLIDARLVQQRTLSDYHRAQPQLARDADLGDLFIPISADDLVNRACLDLLTVIGLGLLFGGAQLP